MKEVLSCTFTETWKQCVVQHTPCLSPQAALIKFKIYSFIVDLCLSVKSAQPKSNRKGPKSRHMADFGRCDPDTSTGQRKLIISYYWIYEVLNSKTAKKCPRWTDRTNSVSLFYGPWLSASLLLLQHKIIWPLLQVGHAREYRTTLLLLLHKKNRKGLFLYVGLMSIQLTRRV